jgi:hypothetical protein
MTNIVIEWKHFDKAGNTCVRCSITGSAIQQALEELKDDLIKNKVNVSFKETKLSENEIQASNSILLNGILLEDLLTETKRVDTNCKSCCEMIGSNIDCRALSCRGQITEDVPVELIKKAINNLLRKEGK